MTKRTKLQKFIPHICEDCRQDTTYELGLDKGSALLVLAIAKFIRQKGINAVHPRKEMEGKVLTSNQVGNLSRPRFHGLIAKVQGNSGNYLLTPKGSKFLRGETIPKIAIVQKATISEAAHNIGYHLPEEITTSFKELVKNEQYWEGIDYEIVEGNIISANANNNFPLPFTEASGLI